jgi:hypothetical protein
LDWFGKVFRSSQPNQRGVRSESGGAAKINDLTRHHPLSSIIGNAQRKEDLPALRAKTMQLPAKAKSP